MKRTASKRPVVRVGSIAGAALVLLLCSTAVADPDLPNPSPNVELIPAGSLVIPMDNDKQVDGGLFNLKAYGAVVSLLWDEVPVKWVIKAGKAQDEADFTADARRLLPSAAPSDLLPFPGGPFVVHADWAALALSRLSLYGNNVAVYELTADVSADVRYTLTQKPKVGALDDGNNSAIHLNILARAGLVLGTHYEEIASATSLTINSDTCVTIVTEPHFKETPPASNPQTQSIRDFLTSGGNFLAQCAGVETYENNPTYGRFQTTLGIEVDNLGESFEYIQPDLPYTQIHGVLATGGGSVHDWQPAAGSVFHNNGAELIRDTPSTDHFPATVAKLTSPGVGSVVFYLGAHSYKSNSNAEINGQRLYMNAVMTPSSRPGNCGFDFIPDPPLLPQISGNVYHDGNASDTFDPGEPGIGTAWVKLLDGGSVIDVVAADFDTGAYSFADVADGSYTVIVDDNATISDVTPTEPPNWTFQNPLTGSLAVVVAGVDVTNLDFGLIFEFDPGATCACGYEDGQFTLQGITIDGDTADWGPVLADLDNSQCDPADDTDRDYPVQSTGRNLVRTAATWDGSYFAMFTERTGQANNTQNFIYYADADSNEIMEAGEPVVVARWQGSTGTVNLDLYAYDDLGSGGDPMLDGGGFADGHSLPGDLTFVKALPAASAIGVTTGAADGTQMEWKILWSDLALPAGSAISWHVGSTNSNPGSAGLGAQIDDNMGGCGGQCSGSNQQGGVQLAPVGATAGTTVYAAHQLTNTGNGFDVFDFSWSSTGDFVPLGVTFYHDLGTVGQYDAGVDLAVTDTGQLAAGAQFDLLVAIELPTSPAGDSADVTTTATARFVPECAASPTPEAASVIDTVAIPLNLVKRAFQSDGTPIPDGSTVPSGLPVRFLIYIDNPGALLADVSVQDVLDASFAYVAGSIQVDGSLDSATVCPGGTCDDATIFGQVTGAPATCGALGFECTDAADSDPVSYSAGTTTVHAGNGTETGNAQLDLAAGKVWAMVLTVQVQ